MPDPMNVTLYLQIISMLIGVVAVALPILITVVAFVYVRRLTERMTICLTKSINSGIAWAETHMARVEPSPA